MQTQMRLTAQPALAARTQAPACSSTFLGSKLPVKGAATAELRSSVRRSCAPAAVEVRSSAVQLSLRSFCSLHPVPHACARGVFAPVSRSTQSFVAWESREPVPPGRVPRLGLQTSALDPQYDQRAVSPMRGQPRCAGAALRQRV